MAVFHISPTTTSLTLTFINVLVELAMIFSLRIVIALEECSRLRRGCLLSIRRHCISVKAATLFPITTFVVLGIFLSVNSSSSVKREPCVRTRLVSSKNTKKFNERLSTEAEASVLHCWSPETKFISVRNVQLNLETGRVQCGNIALQYPKLRSTIQLPLNNATVGCHDGFCVFVQIQENTILVSESISRESIDENTGLPPNVMVEFLPTNLTDVTSIPEAREMGEKAVRLFSEHISDELSLRILLFFGSEEGTCDTTVNAPELTEISTWAIAVLCSIWIITLIFFFSMLSYRRKVFYDVSSVSDWAKKTTRLDSPIDNGDVYLKGVLQDGNIHVYVLDNAEDASVCEEMADDVDSVDVK